MRARADYRAAVSSVRARGLKNSPKSSRAHVTNTALNCPARQPAQMKSKIETSVRESLTTRPECLTTRPESLTTRPGARRRRLLLAVLLLAPLAIARTHTATVGAVENAPRPELVLQTGH